MKRNESKPPPPKKWQNLLRKMRVRNPHRKQELIAEEHYGRPEDKNARVIKFKINRIHLCSP